MSKNQTPQNAKPTPAPIVRRQQQRNQQTAKHTPEEYAAWSAKRLDDGLKEVARRFGSLLCDLRRVHPDVRFEVCGKLGGEGLAETFIAAFNDLRYDEAAEVPSFEKAVVDALAKNAVRDRHEQRQ